MQSPPRVLGFGAHPDDMEAHCAGALALLHRAGWKIGIASMTGGEGGSRHHPPDEIRRIRLNEAQQAAELLDADFFCAGAHDMDVDYRRELRIKTVHVLRQFRPDVVITVPPDDYHLDHEQTSLLVRAACFFAPIPNFPEQTLDPIPDVPHLYYTHAGRDILGRPAPLQFCIDITPVREVKRKMLARHASQRQWINDHHHTPDFLDAMQRRDEATGQMVGVEAAEGFCQHLGPGYPHDNVLLEALGLRMS